LRIKKVSAGEEKMKQEPENWERDIFEFACSLACKLAERIFREIDNALKEKDALGMSWTKEGANRMARLISLSHSSKLDTAKKISIGKPAPTPAGMSQR